MKVEKRRFIVRLPARVRAEGSVDSDPNALIVTTVKLPAWLREWLLEVAIKHRCTVSDVVRRAIIYYLESLEVGKCDGEGGG